ncbi:MAG: helix-turn-helix transcriptional regulator, partial [Chloroflexi bacterium]|nr:helix-turn-helix transcriptional regulator [Chloroflexota bacterium]
AISNLSPFHLLRAFRAELGLPPHAYLTQIRIERAKALLAQGWPVAQVAFETGFADQSHLTKRFKGIVGVAPGQYLLHSKKVQDKSA